MKRRSSWVLLVFGSMLVLAACEKKNTKSSEQLAKDQNNAAFETREGKAEADFIVEAVQSTYAEIRLAQLGMNRSTDTGIKEVAAILEKDHANMLNSLKGYANKKGISIPLEEDKAAVRKVKDLANNDVKNFDKLWCKELVHKHQKTIRSMESMWEKTDDADLKEWINETLPDQRNHLVKLNSCEEKLAMR